MRPVHNRTGSLYFELLKAANLDETCTTRLESVRNASAVFVLVGLVVRVVYETNIKDKSAGHNEGHRWTQYHSFDYQVWRMHS